MKSEIEKRLNVWEGHFHGRDDLPCLFISFGRDEKDAVAMIRHENYYEIHFNLNYPSEEDLDIICIEVSKHVPEDMALTTEGGISPGGISALYRFLNYGFKILGHYCGEKCYWGGGIDHERFLRFMSNSENGDKWYPIKSKIVDYEVDTAPRVPILVKKSQLVLED